MPLHVRLIDDAALALYNRNRAARHAAVIRLTEEYMHLTGESKHKRCYLGLYKKVANVINGKPVFKHEAKHVYMYYANNKSWFVGEKDNMEAGQNTGFMYAKSSVPLPNEIMCPWKEWGGSAGWLNMALRVQALTLAAYEEYTQECARKQAAVRALIEANAPDMIELHGMCQHQARYLGAYTREPEFIVNNRPVYRHETTVAYLYYANSNEWYIGSKSKMIVGKDFGHMHMADTSGSVYPHRVRGGVWKEWDGEEWTKVRVTFAPEMVELREGEGEGEGDDDSEGARAQAGAVSATPAVAASGSGVFEHAPATSNSNSNSSRATLGCMGVYRLQSYWRDDHVVYQLRLADTEVEGGCVQDNESAAEHVYLFFSENQLCSDGDGDGADQYSGADRPTSPTNTAVAAANTTAANSSTASRCKGWFVGSGRMKDEGRGWIMRAEDSAEYPHMVTAEWMAGRGEAGEEEATQKVDAEGGKKDGAKEEAARSEKKRLRVLKVQRSWTAWVIKPPPLECPLFPGVYQTALGATTTDPTATCPRRDAMDVDVEEVEPPPPTDKINDSSASVGAASMMLGASSGQSTAEAGATKMEAKAVLHIGGSSTTIDLLAHYLHDANCVVLYTSAQTAKRRGAAGLCHDLQREYGGSLRICGCTCSTDDLIPIQDSLNGLLGLPGNEPSTSRRRHHKFHMKRAVRTAGVSKVPSVQVGGIEAALGWVGDRLGGEYPVVLKTPMDDGSTGVVQCVDEAALRQAFKALETTDKRIDDFEINGCAWCVSEGFISGGGDVGKSPQLMTLAQAKAYCAARPECKGFCFQRTPIAKAKTESKTEEMALLAANKLKGGQEIDLKKKQEQEVAAGVKVVVEGGSADEASKGGGGISVGNKSDEAVDAVEEGDPEEIHSVYFKQHFDCSKSSAWCAYEKLAESKAANPAESEEGAEEDRGVKSEEGAEKGAPAPEEHTKRRKRQRDTGTDDQRALVLEPFLRGAEYVVNGVSVLGEHLICDVWRSEPKQLVCKEGPSKGRMVYDRQELVLPGSVEEERISHFACQVLGAVDVTNGAFHLELVDTSTEPSYAHQRPGTPFTNSCFSTGIAAEGSEGSADLPCNDRSEWGPALIEVNARCGQFQRAHGLHCPLQAQMLRGESHSTSFGSTAQLVPVVLARRGLNQLSLLASAMVEPERTISFTKHLLEMYRQEQASARTSSASAVAVSVKGRGGRVSPVMASAPVSLLVPVPGPLPQASSATITPAPFSTYAVFLQTVGDGEMLASGLEAIMRLRSFHCFDRQLHYEFELLQRLMNAYLHSAAAEPFPYRATFCAAEGVEEAAIEGGKNVYGGGENVKFLREMQRLERAGIMTSRSLGLGVTTPILKPKPRSGHRGRLAIKETACLFTCPGVVLLRDSSMEVLESDYQSIRKMEASGEIYEYTEGAVAPTETDVVTTAVLAVPPRAPPS
jgi:hypothetical protein